MLGIISNIIGGLFSTANTNSANNANARQAAAQRKWQTEENERAYQRNRELAEQQNNLNVEQWYRERQAALEDWNRENAYNSPAAQMQRYRDAGLNPNLIYGQSNTSGGMASPSIAGSMTSGAPATPAAGVSSHPVIPKNFEAMFSRIGDALMNIPFYKQQVRGAKLENDLKAEELAAKKAENSFSDWLMRDDGESSTRDPVFLRYRNSAAGKAMLNQLDREWYELQRMGYEYSVQDEEYEIRETEAQIKRNYMREIRNMSKNFKISEDAALAVAQSFIFSARGIKADTINKEAENVMNDPTFMKNLPAGLPALARFLRMFIK